MDGLRKRYGSHDVLRGLSLQVPTGSLTAVIGRNGAGKSTLLECSVGVRQVESGSIELLGSALRPPGPETLQRLAFVAEDYPLPSHLTIGALEQYCSLMNRRWNGGSVRQWAREAGIEAGRPIHALSGGQRAMLALRLALAKSPQLLILDEPVARLDPVARQMFYDEVRARHHDPLATTIISTHVIAEMDGLADYVALVEAGQVIKSGYVNELTASHRLYPQEDVTSLSDAKVRVVGGVPGIAAVMVETDAEAMGSGVTLSQLALAYMSARAA